MEKMKDFLWILVSSVLFAVATSWFITPANLAPIGIDGVCIMLQTLTGIDSGWFSLAINIPLLVVAWFFISRKYVVYTFVYTVISSAMLIMLNNLQLYEYVSPNNTWITVLVAGAAGGARTAIMLRIGGSTGGVDIIAGIIHKKKPHMNIETPISVLCGVVIALSVLVYGNLGSAVMSAAQMIVYNFTMDRILKPTRNAVEVKIITAQPEAFRADILENLKHGATVLDATGMYSGTERAMIITIVNIRQLNDIVKIARKHPGSFMYFSEVSGVWGNFRWNKLDAVQ